MFSNLTTEVNFHFRKEKYTELNMLYEECCTCTKLCFANTYQAILLKERLRMVPILSFLSLISDIDTLVLKKRLGKLIANCGANMLKTEETDTGKNVNPLEF